MRQTGPWSWRRRRRLVSSVVAAAVVCACLLVAISTVASTSVGIRLLQFNMCGHSCRYAAREKVAGVVDSLDDFHPAAATLNELCRSHLAGIVAGIADRGWAMHARFIVTQPDGCAGEGDYGNAVLTRSQVINTDALTYAAQVPGNPEHRGLLCVTAKLGDRPTHICTTHIVDSLDDPVGDVRRTQIALAARRVDSYGGPVVLMGDFNALPPDGAMSVLYTKQHGDGGNGEFDEIGQGSHRCRCGDTTSFGSKFDYMFVSSRDFDVVDEDLMASSFSDHKVLLGRVTVR
jgi:endonuclease/exonuclease/phosphatase family metal-dependent hydrolase